MLLMLSGIIGFLGSDFIVDSLAGLFGFKAHLIERPIGHLKGVVLDQHQRIYTLDGAYNRIQIYTAEGLFISSWKLPLIFKVIQPAWKIDAENRLHYFLGNQHFRLDPETGFTEDPTRYDILPEPPSLPWNYRLHRPILLPSISKVTPQGEQTLVQSKFHVFGIVTGPLFGWLVTLAGTLLLSLLHKTRPQPKEWHLFGIPFKFR